MDLTRLSEQAAERIEKFSANLNLNLDMSRTGLGIGGLLMLALVAKKISEQPDLSKIPTVGPSGMLSSYAGAIRYMKNGKEMLLEGFAKYGGKPFRIPTANHWLIIVGPKYVEEVRKAPDNVLSFLEATNDLLRVEYTLGPRIHHDPFHIPIIRSQLTRSLGVLCTDIRDEIVTAFNDELPLKGHEWSEFTALKVVQQVVCRTSNRIFVGLPLCRDPEWRALNIKHTLDVVKAGAVINLFPNFMAPFVAQFMTNVPATVNNAYKHLRPVIDERLKAVAEYGKDYPGRPNDLLSWLIDDAEGQQLDPRNLTLYMLAVNFAAIHTTSMSFTHVLFSLAANPQYIKPLREEVETIVAAEGWSKAALGKMRKIDSFLKEEQRRFGIGSLSMGRKALQDFTFSDGTFIPKGSTLSVASFAAHLDERVYKNAEAFDPFRFAEMREEEGEGVKHHFVSTNPEYLPFGHGRHACPGRFFAANELKSMLAHIVTEYDIKLADEAGGQRPANILFGGSVVPNQTAKVLFRKRVD
ncbi:cytochrome P450 [Coniophora puteana RWD-64-598 SS2]|uniref:Cytochrome P450 n=1 Tax=Coniophora puteana (strain RWD-64-598) TaxID=741705 RepID=A0A5M3N7B2_CONPW|nr:cytochrome P450 [Coniophora puteana RWD-64-598 SS2]EIW87323.1 cytochrome P450 [Coniophora puteana RWD-64-598 SS2]